MNVHTRSAQAISGQAKRFAVPQERMELVRARPAPLPQPTQDARMSSTQKHADGKITTRGELRKIMLGMLALHGYTTPRRP